MKNCLCKLALAPVNDMWKVLKLNNSVQDGNSRIRHILADLEEVNKYFAKISIDLAYNEQHIAAFCPALVAGASLQPLYAYEIEPILRKVRKTAPGVDNLPYWVFKQCSVELAEVIAHLYYHTAYWHFTMSVVDCCHYTRPKNTKTVYHF